MPESGAESHGMPPCRVVVLRAEHQGATRWYAAAVKVAIAASMDGPEGGNISCEAAEE